MKTLSLIIACLFLLLFGAKAQISVITIDSARTNNANGIPVDSGLRIQISGVVYGPNSYPTTNGAAFILNDHSKGIQIYSKHKFGYTVNNGDSVVVVGVLSQYGGEAEVDPNSAIPGDTIYKVGTGTMDAPTPVVTIAEANESQLIEIQNVNMSTQTGWVKPSGKHQFSVSVGGYSLNIDSFVSAALFNAPAPTGIYNIVGFGSQYKYSAPYNTGYQLTPRSLNDFILVSGINDVAANSHSVLVYPNPTTGSFIIDLNDETISNVDVRIYDISGRTIWSSKESVNGGRVNISSVNLNNGMYLVEAVNGDNTFHSRITMQR